MSNWTTSKLSDVIEIIGGGTPKRSENKYWNGDIPWLSVADFNNDFRYVNDSIEHITELGLQKSSTKLLDKDHLIISARGIVGCLAQLSVPMAFNQSCYGLNGKEGILDNGFLYYFLKNNISELKQKTHGAVFDTITRDTFEHIQISYPDLDTQKEIAKNLGSFDEKIQLNTQINQTLEQIAQALFKSWFVDFNPVRAKVQALSDGLSLEQAELAAMQAISGKTAEELTALSQAQPDRYAELAETAKAFPCEMVEVDGFEVPKGWEVKRIDEVIQKIPVGKKYSSKTAFSEGLVPILDQGRSGVIGYHNDKPGIKASIEDPIIVFANHTCYMRLISYDFSAIQNVFAFKGKECNLYWLYLATLGKQEFVEYKGHFPDFLIKEIIVPPEELTELFGKYVKESFSKIFINDRENSNLAKIRDLLLPKLLNGGIQNE